MKNVIWIRKPISPSTKLAATLLFIVLILGVWFFLTTADKPENRIISRNVLPNPVDIVKAFPALIKGTTDAGVFEWKKSLLYATWLSFKREFISFLIVLGLSLPLGIFMSCQKTVKSFFYPMLVVGTFIPIAALIPLTQAIFGIEEKQKIIFLTLGMFFVALGLVIKEMEEVDDIYLQTAYTLGFSQMQSIFLVNFPIALPRIWKHFSSVFGLGWGYIIFAEMVNSGGGDAVNGIGWLFISRQRRFQIEDMYAIFFVIIIFAFLFSWLFKLLGNKIFKHEKVL